MNGLSRMMGNYHVRFLGGGAAVTLPCYPTTSVLDASWGTFRQFLSYKAERRDTNLMVIGRFYPSSRLCRACGAINADLALADRVWVCSCGAVHNRDQNAAQNIDTEGLRLFSQHVAVGQPETQNACGVLVRPATAGAGR